MSVDNCTNIIKSGPAFNMSLEQDTKVSTSESELVTYVAKVKEIRATLVQDMSTLYSNVDKFNNAVNVLGFDTVSRMYCSHIKDLSFQRGKEAEVSCLHIKMGELIEKVQSYLSYFNLKIKDMNLENIDLDSSSSRNNHKVYNLFDNVSLIAFELSNLNHIFQDLAPKLLQEERGLHDRWRFYIDECLKPYDRDDNGIRRVTIPNGPDPIFETTENKTKMNSSLGMIIRGIKTDFDLYQFRNSREKNLNELAGFPKIFKILTSEIEKSFNTALKIAGYWSVKVIHKEFKGYTLAQYLAQPEVRSSSADSSSSSCSSSLPDSHLEIEAEKKSQKDFGDYKKSLSELSVEVVYKRHLNSSGSDL